MKNLKNLAAMVESCDDEFLKFDLAYQQVIVLAFPLSLVVHRMLISVLKTDPCADSGPSNKDGKSSYTRYSCNSLHTISNVRRSEDLTWEPALSFSG